MRPRRTRPAKEPVPGSEGGREVDGSVLARLGAGEIAALEEVFNLYGDRVFAVCLGILGDRDDAEDAAQEVFLRAFQQAGKFSGRSRYSTWLLRLAANHTLNLARVRARRGRNAEPLGEDIVSKAPGPEHGAVGSEHRDVLARLLQGLPLEQRQVLVLRELEGLSYGELAEVLGIPIGTVTSRLIRARERLRTLARDSGLDSTEPG
jgi:RNA polymerase sigma-70 factor, ECF subfamily